MWRQFNFYLNEHLLRLYPDSEYFDELFHFKKGLLPILDKYSIEDFLILDQGQYFLLRVKVSNKEAENIKKGLDSLVNDSSDFDKVVPTTWSPENDEKTRILEARERAKRIGISFQGIPKGG
jgi:hypothetical protein